MDYSTASPATEGPPPPRASSSFGDLGCPPEYVRTPRGILKITQMLCSLLTFALSFGWSHYGGGWLTFVAIMGFIKAVTWFVLHLLNAIPDVIFNYFIEVIGYCIWTVFFFISGIVAVVHGPHLSVAGAAAFFAFVCMIVFGADATIQLLELRSAWKARNDRRQVPTRNADEDDIFIRR